MSRAAPALVVFSDLDGTLLRHEDYSWEAARPAVEALGRAGVPLVLTSSKTRSEIEAWRERLGNRDPFICENGGALFVPPGATPEAPEGAERAGPYLRVEFGTPYARLREALAALAAELGVGLRGFGDLARADVAALTGLDGDDLERSLAREYDEPFVPFRPLAGAEEQQLVAAAARLGLRITRGGRFHHLTGGNDKGRAARVLATAYTAGGAPVRTVALGDGDNDLELLEAVTYPVVVARPDGTHAPGLRQGVPRARFTSAAGPAGFAEAVLVLLGELDIRPPGTPPQG